MRLIRLTSILPLLLCCFFLTDCAKEEKPEGVQTPPYATLDTGAKLWFISIHDQGDQAEGGACYWIDPYFDGDGGCRWGHWVNFNGRCTRAGTEYEACEGMSINNYQGTPL